MAISKKMREQMLELCGSIHEDDGLDAKDFHQTRSNKKKSDDHRQLMLCEQVARTLAQVLAESVEESICGLKVERVLPGKQSAGLRVVLRRLLEFDEQECIELLELLKEQEGWLRSEVAAAITRKRVPRLTFEFSWDGSLGTEEDVKYE